MSLLRTAYESLNEEQKEAINHSENTVVLAGPGSGKTATLVVKVAYLLNEVIRPPRGVACITYNRDTVREFRSRLADLGVSAGPRLYLGTVHSFCLNCIVRPFGSIIGKPGLAERKVISEGEEKRVIQTALDAEGYAEPVQRFQSRLTKLRRFLACKEGLTAFDDREIRVAKRYKTALEAAGQIDFEGMVLEALELIEGYAVVRDLLVSRFGWLLVDEYQDLGGPLHRIVMSLCQMAGLKVFAVGDPDQTIYPFTGADPRYLEELAKEKGVREIRLRFNYRSGSKLIVASQAALAPATPRVYSADPKRKDPGEVYIQRVEGGLDAQAADVVRRIIPALVKAAIPLHEICILYRYKGELLNHLVSELTRSGIPFNAERGNRFPRSPVVRWLQQCANWATAAKEEERCLFENLVREYQNLLEDVSPSRLGDGFEADFGHAG